MPASMISFDHVGESSAYKNAIRNCGEHLHIERKNKKSVRHESSTSRPSRLARAAVALLGFAAPAVSTVTLIRLGVAALSVAPVLSQAGTGLAANKNWGGASFWIPTGLPAFDNGGKLSGSQP